MKKLIYAAFAALLLTLAVTAYSDRIENDLETHLIRLHIIANSDSAEDQAVKLRVRDAVLSAFDAGSSPDAAAEAAAQTARQVLAEEGFDYGARGEFVRMQFPMKSYGAFTLPAGSYRAVRVILGSGGGHNWWCVLYPPVCMADEAEAQRLLRGCLQTDSYELITGGDKMRIKFRSAEVAKKFIDLLRQLKANSYCSPN